MKESINTVVQWLDKEVNTLYKRDAKSLTQEIAYPHVRKALVKVRSKLAKVDQTDPMWFMADKRLREFCVKKIGGQFIVTVVWVTSLISETDGDYKKCLAKLGARLK